MATLICTTPSMMRSEVTSMNQPTLLRPELEEIVKEILALRAMAKKDHFFTHKAQREILGRLNAKDLATVARALFEADQQAAVKQLTNV
jgi:hypothetical protein